MRLYWEVARRGYRRYATYRAATWAGVFTNTMFGFMRAYVFVAVFSRTPAVGGYDLRDTVTYTFVTQGVIMLIYIWGWWDIALSIRSGDVVTDLFRPVDYQLYWLAQDLGRAVYHAVFRGIPPFLLGALVFRMRLPSGPGAWLLFLASCALAVCVSFGIRFIVNLAAFWLLDYRGVHALLAGAWTFFGGLVLPVAFFPGLLGTATRLLPFWTTMSLPVDVFLGKAGAEALVVQAVWAAALLLAGRRLLARATRRVVTQGG